MIRLAWLWCRKSPEGCEFEAGFHHLTTGKVSVSPAVNWYLFLHQGRIRQSKQRDGLRLSFAVPKTQWDYTVPTSTRRLETFTFTLNLKGLITQRSNQAISKICFLM